MFSWKIEYVDENSAMKILTFEANAKLLDFTGKRKTASGKWRINIITWSFVPFAVNVILNLSVDSPN